MVTFLEKLNKYTPSEKHREILSGVTDYAIRADRQNRLMELDISLKTPVKKDVLYAIEEDIAKAYSLRGVRLLPKYPRETFTLSYMHEVIEEAYRIGSVTHGFLENYSLSEDGDTITVSIAFSEEGTSLLHKGNYREQ